MVDSNYLNEILNDPDLMEARMLNRQGRLRKLELHRQRVERERQRWNEARGERERNLLRLRVRLGH